MADQATARETIDQYLRMQEEKDLLRFITCGSVDDGKSTLIGRLLFDSKLIFEDQLTALEADSRKAGTTDGNIDFALLVDGLEAEREQGITIDVAYRFFATDKRKFIVADTPGHEQYTRNMATGASTADLAVILIDARKGILPQTRRHSIICSLLGVRQVILAVNKMDLVDFDHATFSEIERDYRALARDLGYESVTCIPISALEGDNTLTRSERTPWYDGPLLMDELEQVSTVRDDVDRPFRFPVQWVNRPNQNFRGFSGTVASGRIGVGDEVAALPSGRTSKVAGIVTHGEEPDSAIAGQAVTLALEDEIDVSRGDLICKADERADTSDQFEAKIIWMGDDPMLPGRPYIMKSATKTATMVVTRLKYGLNVNTLEHQAAKNLELNDLGVCNISLDQRIAFDPYQTNRQTGSFIIIDRMTNNTVGAGMIDFGLRRATNIHWQAVSVDRDARSAMKGQRPRALWFTGLSGSGKSTIANALERRLLLAGKHTYLLDGDNVRHGLNKDLGFTEEDRVENIRRVGEVARLMVDAGLVVLISFISPFRSERRMARDLFGAGEFIEVFVDTPLEVCEQRDPKGLYKKARAGEIKNFTGYDSPYEAPENPELRLDTTELSAEDCAEMILEFLENGD